MRHVLFQEINHPGHLAVDQDPVAVLLEPGQQPIQDVQLPSVRYQTVTVRNDDACNFNEGH